MAMDSATAAAEAGRKIIGVEDMNRAVDFWPSALRLSEALVPQDRKQLQLLISLGARRSSEHEERLRLVLGEQHLAV